MKTITQSLIALFVLMLSVSGTILSSQQAHAAADSKGTDFFIAFTQNLSYKARLSLNITSTAPSNYD